MEIHFLKMHYQDGWRKSKINEHVIEARGSQAPLELMFSERPMFDDALGKVASVIRTEHGLLGVTELMEYFQTKHPDMLIKDFDLHILSIACDELHNYEESLTIAEEVENFDIEQRKSRRVELYFDYESDEGEQTAGEQLGKNMENYNEQLRSLHGDDTFPD
jgi:hypothetical protein